MSWLEALILGLVQGLTEFLPVSSSGHIELGKALLGVEVGGDIAFEVVVHAATALATILVFRKEIGAIFRGLFRFRWNDDTDYFFKLLVSALPIGVVGIAFCGPIKRLFESDAVIPVVGVALLATAALLFFSDRKVRNGSGNPPPADAEGAAARNGITLRQAFLVGCGQALAIVPGLSRSGTTISVGLLCGVRREVVASFSFLMALAPILGKTVLDASSGDLTASSAGAPALAVGFAAAFVSGLFACKAMIALVKRARLVWFALYCVVVGLAALAAHRFA
ncbi:MAG: undecaprenyl-diphosphate phosphatase [Kiritimatiellia bacterium]|jgi:undecaprenyl-diphosphatase